MWKKILSGVYQIALIARTAIVCENVIIATSSIVMVDWVNKFHPTRQQLDGHTHREGGTQYSKYVCI